jgi:hypothetical protein
VFASGSPERPGNLRTACRPSGDAADFFGIARIHALGAFEVAACAGRRPRARAGRRCAEDPPVRRDCAYGGSSRHFALASRRVGIDEPAGARTIRIEGVIEIAVRPSASP